MKLKKLPASATSLLPEASNLGPTVHQEAAYLAQKYGAQRPMLGGGGAGRKLHIQPDNMSDEDKELYWAQLAHPSSDEQRMLKGGHGVPLSGEWPLTAIADRD